MSTTDTKASDKQISYIKDLLDEREIDSTKTLGDLKATAEALTKSEASSWIGRLKELPRKQSSSRSRSPRPEPKAGMYKTTDGTILRVYLGQQSGRMLVKQLVGEGEDWGYEYLGSAAYKLPATATPLPLEEAKRFGKMTGTCCVCARRLDVPESVEAGIGPVCASRMEV